MNSSRIRLTRIIAFNWYGFRTIIDVNGLTLLCGETGTGKSALLDLIQFVMSAGAAKFNKAAAGENNARDLRGYCLCDTNTRLKDGNTRYLRRSGATIAALEFSWPAKLDEEPRRETWGIRVQYSNPTDQPSYVRFYVPNRMERTDLCDESGTLLSEDEFRSRIKRELGGDPGFITNKAFQEEMGVARHLYFDEVQMRKTLPKAIAFELDFDYQKFIREFILEPAQPDVANTRRSLEALRHAETRVNQLHDQQQRLERIAASDKNYQSAIRDAALFGHLRHVLDHEESKDKYLKAELTLKNLRTQHAENLRQLDEVTQARDSAQSKLNEVLLIGSKENSDFSNFENLKRRETDLVEELESLTKQYQTVREFLASRAKAWEQWLKDAEVIGLAVNIDPAEINILRNQDASKALGGTSHLVANFNRIWLEYQTRQLSTSEVIKKLGERQKRLQVQLDQLQAGRTTSMPLLDMLVSADIPARPLGRIVEVIPDAEPWWGIIETLLGDDRNAVLIETERDYNEARKYWMSLPKAEPLINPSEIPIRIPEPNTLATLLETAHPIARRYLDWRLGHIVAVSDIAELLGHPCAATPSGDVNEAPMLRHLTPEKEYTLGEEGLRRLHRIRIAEHAEVTRELIEIGENYKRINDWLSSGKRVQLDQNNVPQSATAIANLPEIRRKLDEARSTVSLLTTPEFEERLKQLQDIQNELKTADQTIGQLRGPVTEFKLQEKQLTEALENARTEQQNSEVAVRTNRAVLPLGITDSEITERLQYAMDNTLSWAQRRSQAEAAKDTWKENAAGARILRQQERQDLLAAHQDEFIEFDLDDNSNHQFDQRLQAIQEHDVEKYEKIASERRSDWEKRLQEDVLDQLRENLKHAQQTVRDFNSILRRGIGAYRYYISQKRDRVHRAIWKLIEQGDDGLQAGDPLLDWKFQEEIQTAKKELMEAIDRPEEKRAAALLDYRNYHNYDLYMLPANHDEDSEGSISLQQNGRNLSGGEGQAPFFVAMLAAFHRVYDRGQRGEQSNLGLVVMDEAFSKLSAGHIADCLALAEKFGHQLILAFPMDRLGTMVRYADSIIQCRVERTADDKGAPTSVVNDVIRWDRDQVAAELLS